MDRLLEELAAWRWEGRETEVVRSGRVPAFRNEFWTSKQRAAHPLHEISYRACFKPQLPRFFVSRLSVPGDLVFDPFMGRGTTLLEASLLGRETLGNDANPLARMLIEPRLDPPHLAEVDARLAGFALDAPGEVPADFGVFFHRRTLNQICRLRDELARRRAAGKEDRVDRWVRMVALNRLTGHSPGFFSVYTLPPNQATSIARQRRINRRRQQHPEYRDVRALVLRKSRSLLRRFDRRAPRGRCRGFFAQSAADRFGWDGPPVRLAVTSPPFLDVVDYRADNWMRCWFAGVDADTVGIVQTRDLGEWRTLVRRALAQVARISAAGAFFAFEVGEVRRGRLPLDPVVVEAAAETPWKPVAVVVNEQRFTKTSNTWGIANNRAGTNTNRIVVLRRR